MQLRIRHGTRFEPAIEHLFNAPICPFLTLNFESERVDMFPVKIVHPHARILFELIEGADADSTVGHIVYPDGNRRSPDPVAADRPVDRTFEPVAEATVFDVIGHPADLLVGREQPVAYRRHSYIPGRNSPIDQRRI